LLSADVPILDDLLELGDPQLSGTVLIMSGVGSSRVGHK